MAGVHQSCPSSAHPHKPFSAYASLANNTCGLVHGDHFADLSRIGLLLCAQPRVDASNDLEQSDLVFEDKHRTPILVHASDAQKWYFLSRQSTSEHLLFIQADSRRTVTMPG